MVSGGAGSRAALLRWVRWLWMVPVVLWLVLTWVTFSPGASVSSVALWLAVASPALIVGYRALFIAGLSVSQSGPQVIYRGLVAARSIDVSSIEEFEIWDVNFFSGVSAGFVQVRRTGKRPVVLWALGYATPDTHDILLREIEGTYADLWGWAARDSGQPRRAESLAPTRIRPSVIEVVSTDILGRRTLWSGSIRSK